VPAKGVLKKVVPILAIAIVATAALLYVRKQNEPKPLVLAGTLEARTVNVGSLVGGRVVRVHVVPGHSSTQLIERMRQTGSTAVRNEAVS